MSNKFDIFRQQRDALDPANASLSVLSTVGHQAINGQEQVTKLLHAWRLKVKAA